MGGKVELRDQDDKPVISGYAAVFYRVDYAGTEYELWPDFIERIDRSAFDAAMNDDVRGLFNHDPGHLLGRTTNGTLKLSIDETGLRYEITPPDTQSGRDVVALLKRGDIDGSSFGFIPRGEDGAEVERDGDRAIRTIRSVELFDVGPVVYPAYKGTSSEARSLDAAKSEYQAYLEAEARKIAINRRKVEISRQLGA